MVENRTPASLHASVLPEAVQDITSLMIEVPPGSYATWARNQSRTVLLWSHELCRGGVTVKVASSVSCLAVRWQVGKERAGAAQSAAGHITNMHTLTPMVHDSAASSAASVRVVNAIILHNGSTPCLQHMCLVLLPVSQGPNQGIELEPVPPPHVRLVTILGQYIVLDIVGYMHVSTPCPVPGVFLGAPGASDAQTLVNPCLVLCHAAIRLMG
jgi:hypothetical protein